MIITNYGKNKMNIRYYKNELPQVNDIVMGKIVTETEYNYSVELIEYNNFVGELPKTQITKKKRPQKKDFVKTNDVLPLLVSNVNDDHLELSKSRLPVKDMELFLIKFGLCEKINKFAIEYYCLYYNYYKKNNLNMLNEIEFMNMTLWNSDYNNETRFITLLKNPLEILSNNHFVEDFKIMIKNNIDSRIKKIEPIIKCSISAVVTSEEGVNGLKDVLNINHNCDNIKITINMETPPIYSIQTEGASLENSKKIITDTINNMQIKMEKYKGHINIMNDPIITQEEQLDLKFMSNNVLKQLIE